MRRRCDTQLVGEKKVASMWFSGALFRRHSGFSNSIGVPARTRSRRWNFSPWHIDGTFEMLDERHHGENRRQWWRRRRRHQRRWLKKVKRNQITRLSNIIECTLRCIFADAPDFVARFRFFSIRFRLASAWPLCDEGKVFRPFEEPISIQVNVFFFGRNVVWWCDGKSSTIKINEIFFLILPHIFIGNKLHWHRHGRGNWKRKISFMQSRATEQKKKKSEI